MWAVERKRFKTFTRFLENGADINNDRMFRTHVDEQEATDPMNAVYEWEPHSIFTPLALAVALGEDSMVAFLLDHGADIEKPGKGLCTCCNGDNTPHLHFGPEQDRRYVDDPDYIMDDESGFCWTPLHFALCRGYESTAMLLIERGANYQVTCPSQGGPWNALHTATRMNHRKIIDYLLDNKLVDINEAGHHGLTPLLLAFYEKHYSLVDMYIDRGADINAVWGSADGGWTIFAMACLRDEFSRASDLLRRGADPEVVLVEAEIGIHWTAIGLIYGNLYNACDGMDGYCLLQTDIIDSRRRRRLEEQIIQVRIDKALQQQREENTD